MFRRYKAAIVGAHNEPLFAAAEARAPSGFGNERHHTFEGVQAVL
jgi:hypothetical protein